MIDYFNREISYLRISVTDRCNMRCVYCMPEDGICKLSHGEILSLEGITEVASEAAALGIKKLRLTGGEPLVRRGITELAAKLKSISGIKELSLTTNGTLLPGLAKDLRNAGVDRINISIDTLNPKKYFKITRGGSLSDALAGLHAALDAGFEKIKINTVLISGFNDDEIADLAELTKNNAIDLRFIELMPMPNTVIPVGTYISSDIVLERITGLQTLQTDGVARLYKKDGYKGKIGIIAPVSHSFCESCNRIRLTADGYLKPCLHSTDEISVKGLHGEELRQAIEKAILSKPKEHELLDAMHPSHSKREMGRIGG